jgi:hypothetical protein
MSISSFNELPLADAMRLVKDIYVPLGGTAILLGGVGAGKSETAVAMTDELAAKNPSFGSVYVNLGGYESVDMRGMPLPALSVGTQGLSRFACPDMFRSAIYWNSPTEPALDGNGRLRFKPSGLAIFDEITQVADPGVQNVLAPLMLDGGVGEHRLPRGKGGWSILALGNRPDDRANASRLPALLWNRCDFAAHVRPDADGWRLWAMRSGKVPLPFVIFAGREAAVVFTGKSPLEDGPFCTPRSLTKTAAALELHGSRPLTWKGDDGADEAWAPTMWPERVPGDELAFHIVAGGIGAPAAGKFFDLMRHIKDRPSFDEIIADPAKARLPKDGAVQFSVVDTLAMRADKATIGKVCKYVARMPRSLMASFCRWATARDVGLSQPIARSGLALAAGMDLSIAMSED